MRYTETISVRLQPEINPFFGDSPNGLCLSADEKTLYVANGMDNALAVIKLGKKALRNRSNSRQAGLQDLYRPELILPQSPCLINGYLYV